MKTLKNNIDSNKKMSINDILKQTRTKQTEHTHLSMGSFKSKYNFSSKNLDDFFNLYDPEKDILCLAEKPQHYSPVLVDIDIKQEENSKLQRNDKHVLEIIKTYQTVIKDIIENINDEDLTCILLDKPKYKSIQNNKTYIKNGFHLHFPYIFLSKTDHEIHLISRVKQQIEKLQTFKDLGFENSSSLIDNITSNAWLIYGCVKSEEMKPYLISKIFNHKCQEISTLDALKNYPLLNRQEKKINLNSEKEIIKNLPRILSLVNKLRGNIVFKQTKQGLTNPMQIQQQNKRKHKNNTSTYNNKTQQQLLDEAKQLVNMLSNSRADDRLEWLKIGWILYNISEGNEEGFQIWNNFSSLSIDKYDEIVCEHEWDKMIVRDGLTIGSLHYYAKQDNPKEYKRFIMKNNEKLLFESLDSAGHYDIAKLFQQVYGYNNVKITCQKNLSCYIWNDDEKLWIESSKETLAKKMSNIIFPIYIKAGKQIFEKLQDCDKSEKSSLESKLKSLQKMISSLKSSPYINHCLKALAGDDYDKDFETKIINRKPDELPIKNGKVINFKTLEVRERNFNDFWSFECDVSFLGEKANLSCVEKFFNDICCNSSNLVDYHRRLWGYLLTGEISDRSLHIFWGSGCNGKSSLVNIFSNITKNFTASLNEDVMLKKSSRGATPELMSLLNARCGALPESDKKEELNSKRVKSITGDDVITARRLFGHPISFKTQCKPIWATNHKPKINIDDQAILDRLKLIPFMARFEKSDINTKYIKDLQENKLDEFFTWFCLGACDWYNGQELKPSKEMTDEMNKYISENDVVSEFLQDTYDLIDKEEYNKLPKLEKKDWIYNRKIAYCDFMIWINENNRKDDSLGKKDFILQLEKKVVSIRSIKIKCGFLAKKKENENFQSEENDYDGMPPL